MCGFAGFFYLRPSLSKNDMLLLVKKMSEKIAHRGPDDFGEWVDENAGIGLGHRRLSILDLSSAGHQPMISQNQRFVLAYNGEIYNFHELRIELEKNGIQFTGNSDTEVLLESISYWGIERALKRFNGMFAFALWDRADRSLLLARDRVGKKPLYYGCSENVLLFGSELKALREHPNFNNEIDRGALKQYVKYNWFSGPTSIYKNIKKLNPGSYIKILQSEVTGRLNPINYWSAEDTALSGLANIEQCSYLESIDQLEKLMLKSVNRRMIADVDLGAFLSGGIDSSLIVSLMQSQRKERIKTFSIGFNEVSHNEAEYAKNVANHWQTDHTEMYVSSQDCLDVIPNLPAIYDEPLGDASQIPTYLVSKLASKNVKVVLSGDGGDELFAGYTRYFRCIKHWQKQRKIPACLRNFLGKNCEISAEILWNATKLFETNKGLKGWRGLGARLNKRSRRLASDNCLELFIHMLQNDGVADDLFVSDKANQYYFDLNEQWPDLQEPMYNMMFMDFKTYLTDDILVKVDRASMAESLEVRCPLLDQDIIAFSWQLAYDAKIEGEIGKKILRDILAKYIPNELTDRKKMGFGIPVASWLRGSLKDWAEELIDPYKLREQNFFNERFVSKLWHQHQSGWRNHSDLLWSILMFQSWYDYNNKIDLN